MTAEILRYAAFTDPAQPGGGNPAGIVPDATGLDDARMQEIAAEVGYAETAFVRPAVDGRIPLRFFSPVAEVPFCGHATVATAVALAERDGVGTLRFATPVGEVLIETEESGGAIRATFTSVDPVVSELPDAVRETLLGLLGLADAHLDPRFPPRIAYAGNRHPVLVIGEQHRFDGFTFDPDAVRALMDAEGWTGTVTVAHPSRDGAGAEPGIGVWEARNIFPVGTMDEDPATGSAAASFGGYLRELGLVPESGRIRILQGRHVGRPSLLEVEIPPTGGIRVTGTASPI
ncbi:MAG: PhzF family phenazine biosynthesis isomerase [Microbacterium sp.]|uniref:PhzF family phenazine biosynthesis protein n=1 Tax=Microbacterium sp. TaxID=51671 RepID=UPI0026183BD2|nr:PhzF family phenazine biosynthesis isomerase [Microbacterium sp.]MCX6501985.1 PhzF family phenazine biosynthesis isomerase [Microbacterium sp.]